MQQNYVGVEYRKAGLKISLVGAYVKQCPYKIYWVQDSPPPSKKGD